MERARRPAVPWVAAASGTVFEWYDFYLFIVLAPVLAHHFLSALPPAHADTFVVLLFVAGFLTRPLGALMFGSLGDRWGRKTPFFVTLLVMSLSTANVALLPTGSQWGLAAPVALLLQRAMQGLALGGEYGGAVTLVAESAPAGQRGLYTSLLQTTASVGLLLAIGVVALLRAWLGEQAFFDWGWRIPYALSATLLLGSAWLRLRLVESPVFERLQDRGETAPSPLRRLLGTSGGRRALWLGLFGLSAGQAVLWYTSHVYTLVVLQGPLDLAVGTALPTVALVIAACLPLVVLAGWWSDRIGRRPVVLAGLLLGALCTLPVFAGLERLVRPAVAVSTAAAPTVELQATDCSSAFRLLGIAAHSPCDDIRRHLIARGVAHELVEAVVPDGAGASRLRVGGEVLHHPDPGDHRPLAARVDERLERAGLVGATPALAPGSLRWWGLVSLLMVLGACVALVYGPLAAALAELFPAAIRYSGSSLAYHLGNGVFGGLLPVIAATAIAASGEPMAGLAYPTLVALGGFLVAWRWLPEGRGADFRT